MESNMIRVDPNPQQKAPDPNPQKFKKKKIIIKEPFEKLSALSISNFFPLSLSTLSLTANSLSHLPSLSLSCLRLPQNSSLFSLPLSLFHREKKIHFSSSSSSSIYPFLPQQWSISCSQETLSCEILMPPIPLLLRRALAAESRVDLLGSRNHVKRTLRLQIRTPWFPIPNPRRLSWRVRFLQGLRRLLIHSSGSSLWILYRRIPSLGFWILVSRYVGYVLWFCVVWFVFVGILSGDVIVWVLDSVELCLAKWIDWCSLQLNWDTRTEWICFLFSSHLFWMSDMRCDSVCFGSFLLEFSVEKWQFQF